MNVSYEFDSGCYPGVGCDQPDWLKGCASTGVTEHCQHSLSRSLIRATYSLRVTRSKLGVMLFSPVVVIVDRGELQLDAKK